MIPVNAGPVIHKPCAIDDSVRFGARVIVWQFTTICAGTVIGDDVVIGSGCFIGKNVTIGNGCRIQHGAFLPNGTVLKHRVFVGPGVMMTDDKHPRVNNPNYKAEPPLIMAGASIGAGAVILPGVVVGDRAMVAAGAVVTKDVPVDDTAVGVPARLRLVSDEKPFIGTVN